MKEQLNFKNTPNDILKPVDPNAADEDLAYYPQVRSNSILRTHPTIYSNQSTQTENECGFVCYCKGFGVIARQIGSKKIEIIVIFFSNNHIIYKSLYK
jgi:hypothetical protein